MAISRVYRQRRRAESTDRTRRQVMGAVRRLLEKGAFHDASVEEIARQAGVSRATLYQHFGSRLGLVDAICESLSDNPSMLGIKGSEEIEDPCEAAIEMVAQAIRFWASEEPLHHQLYGLGTLDEAAADFVRRQTADRRAHIDRVLERLSKAKRLHRGTALQEARASLLLLTSFRTYEELRGSGLSAAEAERFAVARAKELIQPAGSA